MHDKCFKVPIYDMKILIIITNRIGFKLFILIYSLY